MNQFKPPAPPYLGPPAKHSGNGNKPIKRIVIHSTVSPCVRGGARKIAAYFRSQAAGGSAQYVIDPGEVVQSAYDDVICWHAPPNPGTLGLEMCDIPGPVPNDKPSSAAFKAAKRAWRWRRPEQKEMLRRTAVLTAELCLAYDVPPRFLNATRLRKLGRDAEGITTHNVTSTVFRQSTHWDPGFWPKRRFMKMVRAEVARMKKEARRG
jgi:hypothetical protein